MSENISAPASPTPAVVVSEEKDGRVSLTVRSPTVVLTCEEFRALVSDCVAYIARRVRRENEQAQGVA